MSQIAHDWFLKEWLAAVGESVARLEGETGWTHRIASQLVNRKIRWNRDHLDLAAKALRVAPFELLMHPDDAMNIRKLKAAETKLRVAEKRGGAQVVDDSPKVKRAVNH